MRLELLEPFVVRLRDRRGRQAPSRASPSRTRRAGARYPSRDRRSSCGARAPADRVRVVDVDLEAADRLLPGGRRVLQRARRGQLLGLRRGRLRRTGRFPGSRRWLQAHAVVLLLGHLRDLRDDVGDAADELEAAVHERHGLLDQVLDLARRLGERCDSPRTSPATTAKPRPVHPARAFDRGVEREQVRLERISLIIEMMSSTNSPLMSSHRLVTVVSFAPPEVTDGDLLACCACSEFCCTVRRAP